MTTYKQMCYTILDDINEYMANHTANGKNIHTVDMLEELESIIKQGIELYNLLVQDKFYNTYPEITPSLIMLEKQLGKLEMTEKKSKKLDIANAIQTWDQAKVTIAVVASTVLDIEEAFGADVEGMTCH